MNCLSLSLLFVALGLLAIEKALAQDIYKPGSQWYKAGEAQAALQQRNTDKGRQILKALGNERITSEGAYLKLISTIGIFGPTINNIIFNILDDNKNKMSPEVQLRLIGLAKTQPDLDIAARAMVIAATSPKNREVIKILDALAKEGPRFMAEPDATALKGLSAELLIWISDGGESGRVPVSCRQFLKPTKSKNG